MSLREKVAQLCQNIHLFQTEVHWEHIQISLLKEQLFNLPMVTKKLLWNHVIGGAYQRADSNKIVAFFSKHGLSLNKKQIDLIIWVYSSRKDNCLNQQDFWQIFKPLSLKFIDDINQVRQKKYVLAKCHETHYKISDLLCEIIRKTVLFLIKSNQMKRAIVACESEDMQIKPLDPSHLQIYINQCAPTLLLRDVELVFKHIMRNQPICQKTLKQYLIPLHYGKIDKNPNHIHERQEAREMKGLQITKYHFENIKYVESSMKKRPLYLEKHIRR